MFNEWFACFKLMAPIDHSSGSVSSLEPVQGHKKRQLAGKNKTTNPSKFLPGLLNYNMIIPTGLLYITEHHQVTLTFMLVRMWRLYQQNSGTSKKKLCHQTSLSQKKRFFWLVFIKASVTWLGVVHTAKMLPTEVQKHKTWKTCVHVHKSCGSNSYFMQSDYMWSGSIGTVHNFCQWKQENSWTGLFGVAPSS